VQIGLQIPDFTTPDGPARLGADLGTVARTADEAGFDFIAVMDHFFQIGVLGPPEREMLEAYTTLGYLAACTRRAKLLTLVTGTVYRHPGILAKTVTTLDVLSGGRAWLGIGAAWNEEESRGLGISFPPVAERFERLEETLQICRQMWRGDESPYHGVHYQLEAENGRPSAWSPDTPTRATCSRRPTCLASSTYCARTATPRAATTTRSPRPATSSSTWARRARRPARWSISSAAWPALASRPRSALWPTSGRSPRSR